MLHSYASLINFDVDKKKRDMILFINKHSLSSNKFRGKKLSNKWIEW